MTSYLLILNILVPNYNMATVETVRVDSLQLCDKIGTQWVRKMSLKGNKYTSKGIFYTCNKL